MHPFLKLINKGVVVLDGAMGTMLESLVTRSGQEAPPLLESLVLSSPDLVRQVHDAYLDAGADGVETNTFSANRFKLAEHGLEHLVSEINVQAARIARDACDAARLRDGRPRFVVGSIGPTGNLPSIAQHSSLASAPDSASPLDPHLQTSNSIEEHPVYLAYLEQANALLAGGADVLLVETGQDLLEMFMAVRAARRGVEALTSAPGALRRPHPVPVMAQGTINQDGRMLLGTEAGALAVVMEKAGADVIGLNCGLGPVEMGEAVRELAAVVEVPISCLPNGGLPKNINGRAHYDLPPDQFTAALTDLVVKYGVRVIGGCCGTTPEHIRELVSWLRSHPRANAPRPVHRRPFALVSSLLKAVPLSTGDPGRPTLVGERLNAHGSKLARTMMVASNWDGLVDMAASQVESGASIIDLCVAVDGDSAAEAERMVRLVKALQEGGISAPLMLDSTDYGVLKAGLQVTHGKGIINSVNLEDGGRSLDERAALAREHGAALVALCIDEQGMADTCDQKVRVARKLVDRLVSTHGVDPRDIIIDPLTFSLGTGDPKLAGAGAETLQAIRRLKEELPQCPTILGVSNVSYGLPMLARRILNKVFLDLALEAGLDMALVNPLETGRVDLNALPAHVLADARVGIVGGDGDAILRLARWAAQWGKSGVSQAGGSGAPSLSGEVGAVLPPASQPEPHTSGGGLQVSLPLQAGQKLARHIVRGQGDGLEESLKNALSHYGSMHELLDRVLLPAMVEVGERFTAGTLILPMVLRSADLMNRAVALLQSEGFAPRAPDSLPGPGLEGRGTVVLATVKGDVHDIGKNLVGAIMRANGFKVVDLGKQVPAETIVQAVQDEQAQVLGLSALLVSTSRQMAGVVGALHRAGLEVPVLLGGAAVSPSFASSCHFGAKTEEAYPGGVFYCKDAFAGLQTARELTGPERARVIKAARKAAPRPMGQAFPERSGRVAGGAPAPAPAPGVEPEPVAPSLTPCGSIGKGPCSANAGQIWSPTKPIYYSLSLEELEKGYLDLTPILQKGRPSRDLGPARLRARLGGGPPAGGILDPAQSYRDRLGALLESAVNSQDPWLKPVVAVRVAWCTATGSREADHLEVYPVQVPGEGPVDGGCLATLTAPVKLPVGRLGAAQTTETKDCFPPGKPNLGDLIRGRTMVFSNDLLQDYLPDRDEGGRPPRAASNKGRPCPVTTACPPAGGTLGRGGAVGEGEGVPCSQGAKQVVFWAVSTGKGPGELIEKLTAAGETEEALLVHLLAAEVTEALARYVSQVIPRAAGLIGAVSKGTTTVRLSPGYAPWPELRAQNPLVHSIVDPDGKLGLQVSSAFQLIPEYSATGILVPVHRMPRSQGTSTGDPEREHITESGE